MDAAILTVGNEILSGDTRDTNASWLAGRLEERGVRVRRIVVVPDEVDVIAEALRRLKDRYEAVVTTGGLGSTHDDVTMEGVARAHGEPMVVNEAARDDVAAKLDAVRDEYPDLAIEPAEAARMAASAEPLLNPNGLAPGCVVEGTVVLPGIPREMKAIFQQVEERFGGQTRHVETLRTDRPEGALGPLLEETAERFDLEVGSYPSFEGDNRIKLTCPDPDRLRRAARWLRSQLGT